ncbi:response regulator [Donghicola sp. C2-DW-16]|uniref:Response regulator n=1 Tax=Donghicola mangrovi TaxID=2729614 RepID=A0A850QDV2_9RHOB|nr:response regulator [Donghicola mangrovi]NVO24605.1 response regulator [Donghicola mangrovi]NVO28834.1 response regulator [Donghicola mangrovi]
MSSTAGTPDISAQIAADLPYLRRYARALTGSQTTGDKYAITTLEAILADPAIFDRMTSPRVALFKAFNSIWMSSGAPIEADIDLTGPEARAQMRLSRLTSGTREALLLQSIEGFTADQIGEIVGVSGDEAASLLDIARDEMSKGILGNVMVIEDEAIIAMDISEIVAQMGHEVTGIARTKTAAVELARRTPPDMILADIQLADKSSGIDAVNEILAELGDRPVVFITAFPERLLTGDRPEPAFLITKPYSEDQVRSAVSQAMFFTSTETLLA